MALSKPTLTREDVMTKRKNGIKYNHCHRHDTPSNYAYE